MPESTLLAIDTAALPWEARFNEHLGKTLYRKNLVTDPEIIFFDEPTTGLDPIMADVINNLIVDCVKRLGATTISITHDMVSARKIADRIAMIHKGEIIWQGPARAIDTSGNPYVDQFIHGRAEGPIQMEILKA